MPSLYDIHRESAHDHPVRLVPAHHHTRNDSLPSPGINRPWLSPYPLQEMYGCFSHNHNLYMLHGVPSCSIYHIGIIHFYHLQFIALEFSIFFDSNIPEAASSALSYRQVNPSYKSMPGAYLILLSFTHVYQHTCKPAVSTPPPTNPPSQLHNSSTTLYKQKQLVFHESGSCYGSPLLFGCRGICGIRIQWNVFVPVPLHG